MSAKNPSSKDKEITDITMQIPDKAVTAFIGPSGCGKSTLLRLINRMNDLIDGTRLTGNILVEGQDIYDKKVEVEELRKWVWSFRNPIHFLNPFSKM